MEGKARKVGSQVCSAQGVRQSPGCARGLPRRGERVEPRLPRRLRLIAA